MAENNRTLIQAKGISTLDSSIFEPLLAINPIECTINLSSIKDFIIYKDSIILDENNEWNWVEEADILNANADYTITNNSNNNYTLKILKPKTGQYKIVTSNDLKYIDVKLTPEKIEFLDDINCDADKSIINGENNEKIFECWSDYSNVNFYVSARRIAYNNVIDNSSEELTQERINNMASNGGGVINFSTQSETKENLKISSGIKFTKLTSDFAQISDIEITAYYTDASCQFNYIEFTNVSFDFIISDVYFTNCKFINCDFNCSNANLVFKSCEFDNSSFIDSVSESTSLTFLDCTNCNITAGTDSNLFDNINFYRSSLTFDNAILAAKVIEINYLNAISTLDIYTSESLYIENSIFNNAVKFIRENSKINSNYKCNIEKSYFKNNVIFKNTKEPEDVQTASNNFFNGSYKISNCNIVNYTNSNIDTSNYAKLYISRYCKTFYVINSLLQCVPLNDVSIIYENEEPIVDNRNIILFLHCVFLNIFDPEDSENSLTLKQYTINKAHAFINCIANDPNNDNIRFGGSLDVDLISGETKQIQINSKDYDRASSWSVSSNRIGYFKFNNETGYNSIFNNCLNYIFFYDNNNGVLYDWGYSQNILSIFYPYAYEEFPILSNYFPQKDIFGNTRPTIPACGNMSFDIIEKHISIDIDNNNIPAINDIHYCVNNANITLACSESDAVEYKWYYSYFDSDTDNYIFEQLDSTLQNNNKITINAGNFNKPVFDIYCSAKITIGSQTSILYSNILRFSTVNNIWLDKAAGNDNNIGSSSNNPIESLSQLNEIYNNCIGIGENNSTDLNIYLKYTNTSYRDDSDLFTTVLTTGNINIIGDVIINEDNNSVCPVIHCITKTIYSGCSYNISNITFLGSPNNKATLTFNSSENLILNFKFIGAGRHFLRYIIFDFNTHKNDKIIIDNAIFRDSTLTIKKLDNILNDNLKITNCSFNNSILHNYSNTEICKDCSFFNKSIIYNVQTNINGKNFTVFPSINFDNFEFGGTNFTRCHFDDCTIIPNTSSRANNISVLLTITTFSNCAFNNCSIDYTQPLTNFVAGKAITAFCSFCDTNIILPTDQTNYSDYIKHLYDTSNTALEISTGESYYLAENSENGECFGKKTIIKTAAYNSDSQVEIPSNVSFTYGSNTSLPIDLSQYECFKYDIVGRERKFNTISNYGCLILPVYYVSNSGNDNNSGYSWLTAFETIEKAIEETNKTYGIINVAQGAYYPYSNQSNIEEKFETATLDNKEYTIITLNNEQKVAYGTDDIWWKTENLCTINNDENGKHIIYNGERIPVSINEHNSRYNNISLGSNIALFGGWKGDEKESDPKAEGYKTIIYGYRDSSIYNTENIIVSDDKISTSNFTKNIKDGININFIKQNEKIITYNYPNKSYINLVNENRKNPFHILYAKDIKNCTIDGFEICGGCAQIYPRVRARLVKPDSNDTSNTDGWIQTNYELNHENFGGAIFAENAELNISNCKFTYNESHYHGSAIYSGKSSFINIKNCYFENNRTQDGGGTVFANGRTVLNVEDCEFVNNIIATNGAAIYVSSSRDSVDSTNRDYYDFRCKVAINRCNFQRNYADTGIIYLRNQSMQINECSFVNNYSIAETGACISYSRNTKSNIDLSWFNFGFSPISNCIFYNNKKNLKVDNPNKAKGYSISHTGHNANVGANDTRINVSNCLLYSNVNYYNSEAHDINHIKSEIYDIVTPDITATNVNSIIPAGCYYKDISNEYDCWASEELVTALNPNIKDSALSYINQQNQINKDLKGIYTTYASLNSLNAFTYNGNEYSGETNIRFWKQLKNQIIEDNKTKGKNQYIINLSDGEDTYKFTDSSNTIDLTDIATNCEIVFNGNNTIFDANEFNRIFIGLFSKSENQPTIIFKDITFKNAISTDAISLYSEYGSEFANSDSNHYGGAGLFGYCNLVFYNCNFENCETYEWNNENDNTYRDGGGALFTYQTNMSINYCKFNNINSGSNGGIIYIKGANIVNNNAQVGFDNRDDNNARSYLGFSNNTITDINSIHAASGIYLKYIQNAIIYNSYFENCKSQNNSGTISNAATKSAIIYNNSFNNCFNSSIDCCYYNSFSTNAATQNGTGHNINVFLLNNSIISNFNSIKSWYKTRTTQSYGGKVINEYVKNNILFDADQTNPEIPNTYNPAKNIPNIYKTEENSLGYKQIVGTTSESEFTNQDNIIVDTWIEDGMPYVEVTEGGKKKMVPQLSTGEAVEFTGNYETTSIDGLNQIKNNHLSYGVTNGNINLKFPIQNASFLSNIISSIDSLDYIILYWNFYEKYGPESVFVNFIDIIINNILRNIDNINNFIRDNKKLLDLFGKLTTISSDLKYSWYINNVILNDFKGVNCTIKDVSDKDNSKIYCQITDGIQTVKTSIVKFIVADLPIISYNINSKTIYTNTEYEDNIGVLDENTESVILEAIVSNIIENSEISYQWYKIENGNNIVISDAKSSNYEMPDEDKMLKEDITNKIEKYNVSIIYKPSVFSSNTSGRAFFADNSVMVNVRQAVVIDKEATTNYKQHVRIGNTTSFKTVLKKNLADEATYQWYKIGYNNVSQSEIDNPKTIDISKWILAYDGGNEIASQNPPTAVFNYKHTSRVNDNYYYISYVFIKDTDGNILSYDISTPFKLRVLKKANTGNEIDTNIVLFKIPLADLNNSEISVNNNYMVFASANNADLYKNAIGHPTIHIRGDSDDSLYKLDSTEPIKNNINLQQFTPYMFPADIDIDKTSTAWGVASDLSNKYVYILDLENLNYDTKNLVNKPIAKIYIPKLLNENLGYDGYAFERLGFKVFMHGKYIAVSDPYAYKKDSDKKDSDIIYGGRVFLFEFNKSSGIATLKLLIESPDEIKNSSFGDCIEFDDYGNILISASEEINESQIGYEIVDLSLGTIKPSNSSNRSFTFRTKGRVYVYSIDALISYGIQNTIPSTPPEPKQILSSQYILKSINYTNKTWGLFTNKYFSNKIYKIKDIYGGNKINEEFSTIESYNEYYDFNYEYDFTFKKTFPKKYSESNFLNNESNNPNIEISIDYSYYTNSTNELFGSSLSYNNGNLIIGAPYYNNNSGYVELWKYQSGTYVYKGCLTNPKSSYSYFGQNVEMGPNYFLVNYTKGKDNKGNIAKGVDVFDYSDDNVIINNNISIPSTGITKSFGSSMDSYNNTFIINSPEMGRLYRYSYTPSFEIPENFEGESIKQLQLIDLEKQDASLTFGHKIVAVKDKILVSFRSYGSINSELNIKNKGYVPSTEISDLGVYNNSKNVAGYINNINIGTGAVLQYSLVGNEFRLM